ncbi:uncharacterized protein IWZ02DRAFT_77762 [Phyllosticta citriasiana]|uniref:uncharacterized protein n=1 Tax=Phyllosticta citriasiana TaxID=595635 RepID=UPI0030FD2FC2
MPRHERNPFPSSLSSARCSRKKDHLPQGAPINLLAKIAWRILFFFSHLLLILCLSFMSHAAATTSMSSCLQGTRFSFSNWILIDGMHAKCLPLGFLLLLLMSLAPLRCC